MSEAVQEKFHEFYALNHTFQEQDVRQNEKDWYKQVITTYGTWQKGLKANGINKKKLKERERFHLYWILKKRYEKYGEIALRPKNIDPAVKDRVVDVYKTMKELNRIIKNWDADKVLYETRALLLTGEKFEQLKSNHAKLHTQIVKYFDNLEGFQEEYMQRFGIGFAEEGKESEILPEVVVAPHVPEVVVTPHVPQEITPHASLEKEEGLKEMLIRMGVVTEEEFKEMEQAKTKIKDEVIIYAMEEILHAKREARYPSEETIKEKNRVMYYAIKYHFGNLKQVLTEIRDTFSV